MVPATSGLVIVLVNVVPIYSPTSFFVEEKLGEEAEMVPTIAVKDASLPTAKSKNLPSVTPLEPVKNILVVSALTPVLFCASNLT